MSEFTGMGSDVSLTTNFRRVMRNKSLVRALKVEQAALVADVKQMKKEFWQERKVHANLRTCARELGLDPEEMEYLYKQHDHKCEICGVHEDDLPYRLCMDHCHETGTFRGWLCKDCNLGIGRLKDSIDLVTKALSYLESR